MTSDSFKQKYKTSFVNIYSEISLNQTLRSRHKFGLRGDSGLEGLFIKE